MLNYHIIIPCKAHKILGVDECADYQKRLSGRAQIHYMNDMKNLNQKIQQFPRHDSAIWAFDSRGTLCSSDDIAHLLQNHQLQVRHIICLVGDANGIDAHWLNQADQKISFGRITLPHQFMPVLICEQLYRAESIMRGAPYHLGH